MPATSRAWVVVELIFMGLFSVGCKVVNHGDSKKSAVISRLMVDTGSEATWIDGKLLNRIGIEPRKKDLNFQMANGQIITRSVGYAILKVDKRLSLGLGVIPQS